MLFRILTILLVAAAARVSFAADTASYRIFDTKMQRECTLQDIAAVLQPGEVLDFGEQHDDSIGHLVELAMLQAVHGRFGGRTILAMEMFHRDVQYILDEYLQGLISEKNFVKESRAWDKYATDYKPSVEFAKAKGLKVVAANTPSRYANMVTRNGLSSLNNLGKEARKKYLPPLPIDTVTGKYHDNFLVAMGGHTMPGMQLFQSQNLWDATMSWSIYKALKANKGAVVVIYNGRFHSDYRLGLVHRLEADYKKKVTTISSFSVVDLDKVDWADYKDLADYVIVTKAKAQS
ncbi:MAG: ChaN family lipoprotein [Edaphocola sp.]